MVLGRAQISFECRIYKFTMLCLTQRRFTVDAESTTFRILCLTQRRFTLTAEYIKFKCLQATPKTVQQVIRKTTGNARREPVEPLARQLEFVLYQHFDKQGRIQIYAIRRAVRIVAQFCKENQESVGVPVILFSMNFYEFVRIPMDYYEFLRIIENY